MTPRRTPAFILLRAVAALAVVAATAWFGPAAGANHEIRFRECPGEEPTPPPTTAPSEGCMPLEGQYVRGTHWLFFEVRPSLGENTMVELYVFLEGTEPTEPVSTWNLESSTNPSRPWREVAYEWKTDELSVNDWYTIRVRAISSATTGSHPAVATRPHVAADNPPTTPRVPLVASTPNGASINWEEAAEEDAIGYRVNWARTTSRDVKPSNDDFRSNQMMTITDPRKTNIDHEITDSGTYWYQLRVLRNSVVSENGAIGSERSATSEPVVVSAPTPEPTIEPERVTARTAPRATPRPRVTPRPLPRSVNRPPPVQDAPFSALLPYDLPDGEGDTEGASFAPPEREEEDGSRQGLFAAAIGAFLVSSALAIGRMPS